MKLLITPSLLGSWEYYLNCAEEKEAEAKASFLSTLRREPIPDNEDMANGRKFEDAVYSVCRGFEGTFLEGEAYTKCVHEVASYVRGGAWQVKTYKDMTIDGQEFLVYGRIDVLRGPWVYDIKYSHTFDIGKYQDAPQTKIYLDLEEKTIGMRYLVCNGSSVAVDEYRRDSVKSAYSLIATFWRWIKHYPEMNELFVKNWEALGGSN